jgi:hypothetical protein
MTYAVRGTGGTLWSLGDQPGTELVAFAFSDVAPLGGNTPAPGPRISFSVTRSSLVGTVVVRRQWYGDVSIKPEAFQFASDLTQATLEAEVLGSLEERTLTGVVVRRDVPGRLQIRWTPSSSLGNLTATYIYQTPALRATLLTAGRGSATLTSATASVEALGPPIHVTAFGHFSTLTTGTLVVTLQ